MKLVNDQCLLHALIRMLIYANICVLRRVHINLRVSLLAPIDYGGIFNTSTYDYSLTQLTSTDTILYADIMRHLADGLDRSKILERAASLKGFLLESTDKCRENRNQIIDSIPIGWNIPKQNISKKIDELFQTHWIDEVWNNFMECLNDNI